MWGLCSVDPEVAEQIPLDDGAVGTEGTRKGLLPLVHVEVLSHALRLSKTIPPCWQVRSDFKGYLVLLLSTGTPLVTPLVLDRWSG